MPTKTTTAKKPAAPRKPRAKKAGAEPKVETAEATAVVERTPEPKVEHKKPHHTPGKYTYAVGRRKTSVANVRLFSGSEQSTVNGKDAIKYFGNAFGVEHAFKPFQLTGTEKQFFVYVNVKGGGTNSQAGAVAHGIATAIAKAAPEFRKVLKKNGLLTRDSRMKERKKPGLKRARRGPQWAKR